MLYQSAKWLLWLNSLLIWQAAQCWADFCFFPVCSTVKPFKILPAARVTVQVWSFDFDLWCGTLFPSRETTNKQHTCMCMYCTQHVSWNTVIIKTLHFHWTAFQHACAKLALFLASVAMASDSDGQDHLWGRARRVTGGSGCVISHLRSCQTAGVLGGPRGDSGVWCVCVRGVGLSSVSITRAHLAGCH